MTKLFDSKPFIVAEVGSNWTTFAEAKDSIQAAKMCGADAVKFQAFDDAALYGAGVRGSTYTGDTNHHRLPLEWLPQLKEKADAAGIEFMCTAFSPTLVAAVDPFVEVHKIASSDLTDPFMLAAVKKTRKPVILSCGASNLGDIKLALQGNREISWKGFPTDYPLVLMYCNAAYPSHAHNLFHMLTLKQFGYHVGFSDHSQDVIYAPLSAKEHFGATVIEKHFRNIDKQTPDFEHSLNRADFKRMVDALRSISTFSEYGPTTEEHDMMLRHNRRLIATRDIKAGEALDIQKNFGSYRSLEDDSHGLIPFMWEALNGKVAKHDIKCGKGISISDIN